METGKKDEAPPERDLVVVVDDDQEIVSLLVQTLGTRYRVIGVSVPVEALALLLKEKDNVSALVTDQRMPAMTGVELARAVHKHDPRLSIVLLTAYTDPADVVAAINEGEVFRFVTKPWNVSDLLMTVKAAVERTKLGRENEHLLAEQSRHIEALSVVGKVGRDVGPSGSAIEVLSHLLRRLSGVLSFDVASVVLTKSQDGASEQNVVHVHCAKPVGEHVLLRARDRVLELLDEMSEEMSLPGDFLVRVAGLAQSSDGEADAAKASLDEWHELQVPITLPDRIGVIALWSAEKEYTPLDVRLLSVLAGETADLLRQQQEVALRERHHVTSLMSSLADGLITARLDGTITLMNPAALEIMGLLPEAPVDTAAVWTDIGMSPRDAVRRFASEGGMPIRFETVIFDEDVEIIAAPVFDAQTRLVQVAFTLRAGRAESAENEGDQQREDLIANVAHEIKTPLTSVVSGLDLIQQEYLSGLPPAVQRAIGTVREAATRSQRLLGDLIDLGRHGAGKLSLRAAPIDLAALLDKMVATARPNATQRGLEMTLDCTPGVLMCEADDLRIGQVMTNLLSNAVKFAHPGSTVKVTARLTSSSEAVGQAAETSRLTESDEVHISVWNEGLEIPKDEQGRIFGRFEQGSTAALIDQRGSGLGLSISRSLVEAHRGRLQVESGEGRGTTFSVVLPCKQPALEPPAAAAQAAGAPAVATGGTAARAPRAAFGVADVEQQVARRAEAGLAYELYRFTLDNFQAFNKTYGDARGDAVIAQTGDIFREVIAQHGSAQDFFGALAGDECVCLLQPDKAKQLTQRIVQAFDRMMPLYYGAQKEASAVVRLLAQSIAVPADNKASYKDLLERLRSR